MPISIAVHGPISAEDLPLSYLLCPSRHEAVGGMLFQQATSQLPCYFCLDPLQGNIATKAYFLSFDQYLLECNEGLLHQMFPTFPLGINYAYSSPPLLSKTQRKLATGDGLSAQISCGLSSQDRV